MDRRAFLLMTLAGSAAPAPADDPVGRLLEGLQPEQSPGAAFQAWADDFIERAIRDGQPAEVLRREFEGLRPDPRVLAADARQPEFSRPVGDYVKAVVTPAAVAMARRKRAELAWLPQVEARFGVPSEILVAIWAVESNFGDIQGDLDVLRCLATLAAAGRRRAWAESEILALIRIIATHRAARAQLKGSWAGAMGQTQFEPDVYLSTGVSFAGDAAPDIWGSPADALSSAANLLAKVGWRSGQHWQREVRLPGGFDYGLAEGADRTPAAWAELGVKPADAGGWTAPDREALMILILPAGAAGPAFLAEPNHFVIRKYNNSLAYALAVGLLADRIAGAPPLVAPWPPETPLSTADRTGAQQDLARLGFDPGPIDGAIGLSTRQALRAWQKARGLPADGYLSLDMVRRLRGEASPSATGAGD